MSKFNHTHRSDKDTQVRELLKQDKSMPPAPEGEWNTIHSQLPFKKDQRSSFPLWSRLGGGLAACLVLAVLFYPKLKREAPLDQWSESMQEEQLVSYLFDDVGPHEAAEEEEFLPGFSSI